MFTSTSKMSALLVGAVVVSASAALAVSGDAIQSKTLNTSPLYSTIGQSYHACTVAAVTTTSVGVKVDLLDDQGNTLKSSGSSPYTLTAGKIYELALGANIESYTGLARCRIEVVNGNTDAIRANESVYYNTGTYYTTIAFSEAR